MPNNTERTAWLVGLVGALVLGMPAVGSGQGTVADDRAALEALYDATNGANWSRNDNWKTDEPLGQWFGVRTNSDGRVTRLELVDNRLSGTIPVEIGNLTSLSELFLGFSQLSGTIPVEIGNLTSLIALFLGGNQLSGTIPVEIGNLTSLIALFLGGNQLSGTIPVEIGNLTSLRSLTLGGNQLSGTIPVEIGNLTSLSELYLNDNQLSGTIPVEIGNLTSLSRLRIDTTTGLCLAPDFDLASPRVRGSASTLGPKRKPRGPSPSVRGSLFLRAHWFLKPSVDPPVDPRWPRDACKILKNRCLRSL